MKNKNLPRYRKINIWVLVLSQLPLFIFFSNCSQRQGNLEVSGLTLSSIDGSGTPPPPLLSTGVCNDSVLMADYSTGYYSFVRTHKCQLCHGTNGTGPGFGVDNLTQAFQVFQYAPGQFIDSILNGNAVDPNHHGAGDPTNKPAIDALAAAWKTSVATNCKDATGAPIATKAYLYRLTPKPVSLVPGGSVDLTWQLESDTTPVSLAPVPAVTFSVRVTASAATDVQGGYKISRMFITTKTKGVRVSGAKVELNGEIYKYGSTFINSIADLPSNVTDYPMALGNVFIPATTKAGDMISIHLGNIEVPTLADNFVMASGSIVIPSVPPKFSELVAPGGVLAVNCVQCHNPKFKTANLNILDYNSVMQFVTVGLHSSHGDPESPIIYLLNGTDPNVMPPNGKTSGYSLFTQFVAWFEAGGLNN